MNILRRGSVLVMSLLTVFVAATLTGAMCGYYAHTARLAENVYIERDRTRDKSNYALQYIHQKINDSLGNVLDEQLVAISGTSADASDLYNVLAGLNNTSITIDDHYRATFEIQGMDAIKSLMDEGSAVVTVEEKVYKDGELVGIFYEDIEFYTTSTAALTTLKMFDYVYLASKYGHLYPSGRTKFVVNGSVHSNGKFDIDNATINGFISAANGVTVTNSKIWPYWTYQAKVKDKYYEVLTQVRPTDPTRTNENVTTGIKWVGGYEPVADFIGTYSSKPPTNVVDGVSEDEPIKGEGDYAYPDTPEPIKGEGEYAYTKGPEPIKGQGDYAYPDTPEPIKGQGDYAYTSDPEPIKGQGKYAYPTDPEPIKGQGKYAYTSDPEPIKGQGKYAYPTDPEPIKGQGKYAYPTDPEPKKGEGKYAYEKTPEPKKGEGIYAYEQTDEPIKGQGIYAYEQTDEPIKGQGIYAYEKSAEPKKNEGIYKYPDAPVQVSKNKYTYKGTEHNGKKAEKEVNDLYNADCKALDDAWKKAHDEWVKNGGVTKAEKKKKDDAWKKAHDEWVKNGGVTEAERKKKDDAWQKAHDEWVKTGGVTAAEKAAKDALWEKDHAAWKKARDDKDAAWKTAYDAWKKARDDKDALWKTDHDAWVAAGGDDHAAKDALWEKDHAAWQKARDDKDALWKTDHDAWVKAAGDDHEAKDKAWEAAHKAWEDARKAKDDAWQEAHDLWVANGGASSASISEQDAKWQTAHDAWQKARDDKDAEWKTAHDAWEKGNADYNKQHEAYLKYLKAYEEWEKGRTKWEADERAKIRSGTLEVDITSSTYTVITNNIIVTNKVSISMPDISPNAENIAKYKQFCKEYVVSTNQTGTGGTLTCWNKEEDGSRIVLTNVCEKITRYKGTGGSSTYAGKILAEEKKYPRKLAQVKIVNGYEYGTGFAGYPFEYDSSSIFASLKSTEKNSVILIGTSAHPIEINGPVFIDGDVLIRGIVRGRGTIYASRNIHIIGDLIYENPPAWPARYMTDRNLGPDAVAKNNQSKDLLSLIAMKSIVVGDYTSENWQKQENMQYLTAYNVNDGGKKVDVTITDNGWSSDHIMKATHIGGGVTESDLINNYPVLYNQLGFVYLLMFSENIVSATASISNSRKCYETVLGNYLVASFQPSTPPRSLRDRFFGITHDPSDEVHTDAHYITQIDAILYANNAIMGEVGGKNKHQFTLNGAMICADECLFPSFNSRFAGVSGDAPIIWLNWDLRVRSDAKGGLRIGLEEDYRDDSDSAVRIGARVIGLRQVQ